MRLGPKSKAKSALAQIHAHCKSLNPSVEKALGPFLFRFLTTVESILTKEQWSELAERLTSASLKRKRKLERLKSLLEKADDSDIEKFEQKIERKRTDLISNRDQNQLNPADFVANE